MIRETDPQVITSKQYCSLYDPFNITGSNSPTVHEMIIMCCAVNKYECRDILEIGTFLGHTIINLSLNSAQPGNAVTVDLAHDSKVALPAGFHNKTVNAEVGKMLKDFTHIKQVRVDSSKYDYSEFPNGVDFVFIDGCHAYDFVKADSELALSHLREGGIVFWHDYWLDVKKYLDGLTIPLNHFTGTSLVCYRKGARL
jgi:predicted O-methyltransferase YrrM